MIKIFGGAYRGYPLKAPPTSQTRPTSVLLRRKLFDSIQDFSGVFFIDLCAGTGSVGLEASSRGAKKVVFVEKQKACFKVLNQNILDIQKKYTVTSQLNAISMDFVKWLKQNEKSILEQEDVFIFFDPPYEKIELYENLFSWIESSHFKGKLVIEACQQKTMPINKFEEHFKKSKKSFKQGTSYFLVYDFE